MRQLTSLDLQFLTIENATHCGHVAGVSVLDPTDAPGGPVTLEGLRDLVAGRLHLVPPLRRRLVEVPLGIDRPYWIEDPDFDLEFHLRELALPAPGDARKLGEQVARLHARPLDRGRPLWELYLVHGLEGGRQAIYGKVHHAVIDGVSGGEILGILMDRTPVPRTVDPPEEGWRGETPPGQFRLLGRGLRNLATHPARALRALPRLLPHLDDLPGAAMVPGTAAIARAADQVARAARRSTRPADLPARPNLEVPRTPFNGPITPHRRFAYGSVSRAEVRDVRRAFGCTDNDVVMALCTSALRRWLIDHDALPELPLIAGVPVSLRARRDAPDGAAGGGNQISLLVAPLPTNVADPAERLAALAEAMYAAKRRFQAMPAGWLEDMTDLVPAALAGLASRAVTNLLNRSATSPFNLLISNVPGPQVPLYVAGARMLGHYPVSAVSDAFGGLNMTVVGYDGRLDFGLVACREMVPDLWDMAGHLGDALAELVAAAPAPVPSE
jgi:diacylglycerol O-acyltransferase